ncbi:hypothetical protein WR25_16980 [Diploscapter pachys]|uniref:CCHC-type domain-containing protein n=1 Tax=Diploscapter pachys TaxID=2018661 RepID=A0A2A2JK88_9BILA|nr:hypothetical protein WR25_16980 [Diploscapter pachys]
MTNEEIGLEPALESEMKKKKKKSPAELEKQRAALANANTSGIEKKKKKEKVKTNGDSVAPKVIENGENPEKITKKKKKKAKKNGDTASPKVDQNGQKEDESSKISKKQKKKGEKSEKLKSDEEFKGLMGEIEQAKQETEAAGRKQKLMSELVNYEGTLEDLKKMVTELVKKKKLFRKEAGDVVHKWKNREKRRVGRQVEKQIRKVCLNCRESDHHVAECPKLNAENAVSGKSEQSSGTAIGICFKCGSTEHAIYQCRKKIMGFPFATCFVCKQQGHLSRDCKQNQKGVYPDGGSCNLCGSNQHLKRDCTELKDQKKRANEKKREFSARTIKPTDSADQDYDPIDEKRDEQPAKKKPKLIKF